MSLELTEEDREGILQSLRRVGPDKIVGYLPLYTIRDVLRRNPEELEAEAHFRGLATVRLEADHCCIKSGALYVYDPRSLAAIFEISSIALRENGWPSAPDEFVRRIAAEWLEPDDPIMPVIEAVFGDGVLQQARNENINSAKSV